MSKILVIEDEAPLLEEIVDLLRYEDYEVIPAHNGRDGIAQALEHVPDLILSDVMMPETDGYRVLLELRTHDSTALTPFIFLTALADRTNIRYGMELGADDYITKPFTRDELLNAVQSRLKKQAFIQHQSESVLDELRLNIIHSLPHELRTPLVSILGFGELLMQDVAAARSPEQLMVMAEGIVHGGRRLYRLVENYLLYAQLELYRDSMATDEKIEHPQSIMARMGEQIAFQHERPDDLYVQAIDQVIYISEANLQKIVYELLDNAFKYSKAGSQVTVSGGVVNGRYHVQVTDHGRGITAENLKKVGAYNQFERESYEQQGSGLGLPISKRLTELQGGVLRVESTPGVGTSVHVEILM